VKLKNILEDLHVELVVVDYEDWQAPALLIRTSAIVVRAGNLAINSVV
jgi:hypothetical protein